jgi:hypothetical protein
MKNLRICKTLVILLMIFCTNNMMAQAIDKNNIPDAVTAAFTAKYPKAEVKKWTVTDDGYTAKAKQDSYTFYATFDKSSQWRETASKIAWSWDLPADVKGALRQSKYAAWRVDKLKKVETPNGDFYQVLVDNLYLQPDADHAAFAENYILNFKPDGELFGKKSISSTLLF